MVLVFKKRGPANLENYRPISLLSYLYKLRTKTIDRRLEAKLDFYHPIRQRGFRSGYGTNDHLLALKTLIEKTIQQNRSFVLVFTDCQKEFDMIKMNSMLETLDQYRIDYRYTRLIHNIYSNLRVSMNLHRNSNTFRIERGKARRYDVSQIIYSHFGICIQSTRLAECGCQHPWKKAEQPAIFR